LYIIGNSAAAPGKARIPLIVIPTGRRRAAENESAKTIKQPA
jgi:hypothetical protein